MNKKIIATILGLCVVILPVKAFAVTKNHVPYISKSKIEQVESTEVIVDNTRGDLQPGESFTIRLENAEFDVSDDGRINMYSNSFYLNGFSNKSIYATLKDDAPGIASFSFHSKILGDNARVIIDSEDSGISSGSYLYATTGGSTTTNVGEVEKITPMRFDTSIKIPAIIIKEQSEAAFRTAQMYNTSDEDLITFRLKGDLFKIHSTSLYDNITFIVEDGKGNSRYYELGRDPEVEFDYGNNKITFKKANQDIFGVQEQIYTITIENIEVSLKDKEEKSDDLELVFGGLLVGDQTMTLAKSSLEPVKLETSIEEIKPGTRQTIKFKVDEQYQDTLFTEGYINLGIYGDAKIESNSDLKFTLKDGINTYNELEKSDFQVDFDPSGDRITIKNYKRKDTKNGLRLEGELTVTVPTKVTRDIEFYINEPSLTESVKKTALIKPEIEEPESPEKPETPEPTLPSYSKVEFIEGSNHYKIDGVSYPLDAKAYVSKHNRIMVPVRYLPAAVGAEEKDLKWDANTGIITIKGEDDITIDTRKNEVARNSIITTLSDIEIIKGRTFVPVGEIGKALEMRVYWNGESRTATFN